MAISKQQPMRPAEVKLVDAVNGFDTRIIAVEGGLEDNNQRVTTVEEGLASETATREAADAELQQAVSNETNARQAADTALQQAVSNETNARQSADTALQQAVSNETNARQSADATLSEAISTLATDLTAEESARASADTALQQAIGDETAAREAADNAIASTPATPSTLGMVKVGSGMDVDQDGVISVPPLFRTVGVDLADLSITLNPVSSTAAPGENLNRLTIEVPTELKDDYAVISLCKWELKDSNGNRVDAVPLYQFSMNTQKTLRVGFKTTGTADVIIVSASVEILLIRRS